MVPDGRGRGAPPHREPEGRDAAPRFSPDGKWLAFLSGREGKKSQVFLLPRGGRRGREAHRLQGRRLGPGLVARLRSASPSSSPTSTPTTRTTATRTRRRTRRRRRRSRSSPKRLQFKRDVEGYLKELREHVYVFDVETKTAVQVTSGPYDDVRARLVARRTVRSPSSATARADPDANRRTRTSSWSRPRGRRSPRAITTAPDRGPAPRLVSPDGKLDRVRGGRRPEGHVVRRHHVSVVPVAGGEPQAAHEALDRNVGAARASRRTGAPSTSSSRTAATIHLARVPVEGGSRRADRARRARRLGLRRGPEGRARGAGEPARPAARDLRCVTADGLRRLTPRQRRRS